MVQGIDAYDMSDPVDILKDLTKFDEEVAKTEKWALRKAVLTRLKTLAKVRGAVCAVIQTMGCGLAANGRRRVLKSAGQSVVAITQCDGTCCI